MGYFRGKDAATNLNDAKWKLFERSSAESQKLPPTRATFEKYLQRAYLQINIWVNACCAIIPVTDPVGFGWELQGNVYIPETTDVDIALCHQPNLVSVPMQLC